MLTALVLVCALTACGEQGDGSGAVPEITSGSIPLPTSQNPPSATSSEPDAASDDQPQAPSRGPIGSSAVILYPELADETLTASVLYRQALERPSVICYQEEPLTDPQPLEDFLAAMEKGEDRDLYLYQFYYSEGNSAPYTDRKSVV